MVDERPPETTTRAVFKTDICDNLFDALPDAIAFADTASRITWINRSMAAFLGLPAREVVGRTCHDTLHRTGVPDGTCAACRAAESPGEFSLELELPDRKAWVRITAVPYVDASGRMAGRIHLFSDITAAKRSDERAALSSMRLKLLNRIGNLVLQETDIGAVLEEAAFGTCSLLGVPRCTVRLLGESEELFEYCGAGYPSARALMPFFHCAPDALAVIASGRHVAVDDIRGHSPHEPALQAEIARIRLGSFLGVPIRGRGELLGGLYLDHPAPHAWSEDEIASAGAVARQIAIALRHAQIFREQQEQAGQLLSLFNNVPGVVYQGFRDWSVKFVGTGIHRMTGFTAQEFTRGEVHWQDLVHPDDLAMLKRLFSEAVGAKKSFVRVEYRYRRREGVYRWLVDRRQFIYDNDGNFAYVDGLIIDITDRKRIEEALKASEEQVRQSQKMEAVGRLAGGIAHDFNNLLTAVRGYSDLLLHRLDRDFPYRREIEEIRKAGDRASSLTHQLLAFSRKQMLQPKVLDLNTVVESMEMMLRRLIGEDIDLITVLEPDLWSIRVDPGQIEQVVMNLIINGRDAMPRGGRVIVETANVFLDEDYVRKHPDVAPGPYVMLAIGDTGNGMDEETMSRLFEPFFTTKEAGKGTGLGLSTVYGIIKQSGGDVRVESTIGKGSTFVVYLPRFVADAAGAGGVLAARSLPTGHETILLVEDDELVRRLARDVLEAHGYTVLEARDGIAALDVARTCRAGIHLVLTDVVMPRMGGRELVESLDPELPGVKVLYMSGYTGETILLHGVTEKETPLLTKPFTVDALLRKVREVLDS